MSPSQEPALHGGEYREFLPDLDTPRFKMMAQQDAHVYAEAFKKGGVPPWLHALYMHWLEMLKEPFKGVTSNGIVRPGLFQLQDEGMPIQEIVDATNAVVASLNEKELSRLNYHIDSHEWRTWSNPEFLLSDKGIRLDEVNPSVREATMTVLRTTLSPEGYDKAVGAMRINGFLGELCNGVKVCNEFSYNFALFGTPSTTAPWGFTFYGHHLCLSVFLYKTQVVLSPWFTGAEPNIIDDGPHKGTRILEVEERLGLQLMQSLPAEMQTRAQVFRDMRDTAMPKGRWNHDDQRHLCGAYRDNRVVPYEGIPVDQLDAAQQALLVAILEQYLLFLPAKARAVRMDNVKSWFHETYFCWIGRYGDADPFYYRIQSPVIIAEFDHHSGVFLTNKEPAKFHIHTLLRTPNGGDYGMALRPLIPGIEQKFVWEGET